MPRKTSLYEEYSSLADVEAPKSEERKRAERQASASFRAVLDLLARPRESLTPALEDLGAVPFDYRFTETRDEDWYDEAEWSYDVELIRPRDLPGLVGLAELPPAEVAELVDVVSRESVRFGGTVPDELFEMQIADAIYPDPRWGKLELRVVPKEEAYDFIKKHHSALGGEAKMPPGLMYSIGAYRRPPFGRPELVAVATAGHPPGQWQEWLKDRPAKCNRAGILELTRVASVGGLTTTDRRGRTVPLNASSMLTSRVMDLLPVSGRDGHDGCLFVTYSLPGERGTTYLSLVSKGLRPTTRIRGKKPSGARQGGRGTALGHLPKIRWEYGPAALQPEWSALEGVVPPEQIQGAQRAFEAFLQRDDPGGRRRRRAACSAAGGALRSCAKRNPKSRLMR